MIKQLILEKKKNQGINIVAIRVQCELLKKDDALPDARRRARNAREFW